MQTELVMLLCSCGLILVLMVPLASAMRRQWGFAAMIGNREGLHPLTGWGGRTERAYRNLIDNVMLFVCVLFAASAADVSNATTALGATIFLISRIGHAVFYIAGVAYVRTLAWFGGVVGMGMIVGQII